jgi:hypothetical protein
LWLIDSFISSLSNWSNGALFIVNVYNSVSQPWYLLIFPFIFLECVCITYFLMVCHYSLCFNILTPSKKKGGDRIFCRKRCPFMVTLSWLFVWQFDSCICEHWLKFRSLATEEVNLNYTAFNGTMLRGAIIK